MNVIIPFDAPFAARYIGDTCTGRYAIREIPLLPYKKYLSIMLFRFSLFALDG
jgi:hypothetical protein